MNLLYPEKCLLCGRLLEPDQPFLCDDCLREQPLVPHLRERYPCLDRMTALWYYEGTVRSSLHRFKFGGRRSYAVGYGSLLVQKLDAENFPDFDLLTWVPVSFLRRLRRGYDQSYLIARAFGRGTGRKPVRLLRKVRHRPPQSGLSDASARQANVLGAFRAVHPALIKDQNILLLDDIITTGATAGECARVLLTAGAKSVTCAAVARGRHDSRSSR